MLRLFRQVRPRVPTRQYVTIRAQLPTPIWKAAIAPANKFPTPFYTGVRFQSTQNGPESTKPIDSNSNSSDSNSNSNSSASLKVDTPQLMIAFTCKKCDTRSSHTFSKQAYTKGSVLIQCPGCKNRHLIADNLKIFRDDKVNLEQLLKLQGESVATTPDDLAFEDIPESLKKTLGHYAKDAPEEFKQKEAQRFLEAKREERD